MEQILVTNIQRFSLHDGPGIRTTVFLKGCSVHCPWCCNPENISPLIQQYGKNEICGKWYTSNELFVELIKDKIYFGEFDYNNFNNQLTNVVGGITFSGGECLLQMSRLQSLLKMLKKEKIHIAIETSLFVPRECLNLAIDYVNLFYIDVKILDEKRCKQLIHGDLTQYINNLCYLQQIGTPIIFRVPVIGGYTDDDRNMKSVTKLIESLNRNVLKVELIKEHNLGLTKYELLRIAGNQIAIPASYGVTDDQMSTYMKLLKEHVSTPVEICKI